MIQVKLTPKAIRICSGVICGLAIVMLYVFFAPKRPIGDIFFGGVPALYNVTLAQFFFAQAVAPVLGAPEPYALHQLSRTHFIEGDMNKALLYAYQELEVYPSHEATYYIIGLTLGYVDREREAIEAFSKYIAYDPSTWAAKNDKAWLQFRIADIDGALETIAPIAHMDTNPWIQNTYGVILMNKGRYREAKMAFLNAQRTVNYMTDESWGRSYPGNDPRIYGTGLRAMKISIENNLELLGIKEGN